jgi:hypothetical protein
MMTDEEARALQELAKATGKGLEIIEELGSFLKLIFADPAIEIGGILTDRLKAFRYMQLLKIADKVTTIHKQKGIKGAFFPIPLRLSIPIIEAASLESEESIQDLWAGLIANATDPSKYFQIKRIYVDILSSIEPLDARLLQYLSKQGWNLVIGTPHYGFDSERLASELCVIDYEIRLSLDNLSRLGCVVDEQENLAEKPGHAVRKPKTFYKPSFLGLQLIQACAVGIE